MPSVEFRSVLRWLIPILILAWGLDIAYYAGFYASDDNEYLAAAQQLLDGRRLPADFAALRLMVTLPVAGLLALTPDVQWIALLFTILHPALATVAYWLGAWHHGPRVGLLASALVAICPFVYRFAGAVLPDNLAALWLALALVCLAYGHEAVVSVETPGWRAFLAYGAGGLTIGFAYMAKESALVAVAAAGAAIILTIRKTASHRTAWASVGALVTGVVLVILLETIVARVLVGRWVLRLALIQTTETQVALSDMLTLQGRGLAERAEALVSEWKRSGRTWIWMISISGALYPLVRNRSWSLWLFAIVPFAYFTWGSASITRYNPPPIQDRYYAVVFVPCAILVARLAVAGLDRWVHRWVSSTIFMVALGMIVGSEVARTSGRAGDIYAAWQPGAVQEIYARVAYERPGLPIVLSHRVSSRLRGLLWRSNIPGLLADPDPAQAVRRSPLVLVHEAGELSRGSIAQRFGVTQADVECFDLVYARPRSARLWEGLSRWLAVRPDALEEMRAAGPVYLLVSLLHPPGTRRHEPGSCPAPVLPQPLDREDMRVLKLAGGHKVTWRPGLEEGVVQFFDHGAFGTPPQVDMARLVDPGVSVSTQLELRVLDGDVSLVVEMIGFDSHGHPVAFDRESSPSRTPPQGRWIAALTAVTTPSVTATATRSSSALPVLDPRPNVHSVKARVLLRPRPGTSGSIFVGQLRLSSEERPTESGILWDPTANFGLIPWVLQPQAAQRAAAEMAGLTGLIRPINHLLESRPQSKGCDRAPAHLLRRQGLGVSRGRRDCPGSLREGDPHRPSQPQHAGARRRMQGRSPSG